MNKPCKEWNGLISVNGYGRITIGRNAVVLVHRMSYCLFHNIELKEIKDSLIRHICDNPKCYEPEHLLIGTRQQNMEDMRLRGRSNKGNRHGMSKLTLDDVKNIRDKHVKFCPENGSKSLAREYGISESQIRKIIRGERWQDGTHSQSH